MYIEYTERTVSTWWPPFFPLIDASQHWIRHLLSLYRSRSSQSCRLLSTGTFPDRILLSFFYSCYSLRNYDEGVYPCIVVVATTLLVVFISFSHDWNSQISLSPSCCFIIADISITSCHHCWSGFSSDINCPRGLSARNKLLVRHLISKKTDFRRKPRSVTKQGQYGSAPSDSS